MNFSVRNEIFQARKKWVEKRNLLEKVTFQETWYYAFEKFSFYKWYAAEFGISKNATLDEFINIPAIDRKMITPWLTSISEEMDGQIHFSKTGGTSGRVMNFPVCKLQSMVNFVNVWTIREKLGISISNPLIRFWGRSELFTNKKERIKQSGIEYTKRLLFNEKKISSYRLEEKNIEYLVEQIEKTSGSTVILYGSHLRLILNFIEQREGILNWKNRKFIFTSDTCDADLVKFIKLTNSKVIGEYGAAEAGVIAYSSFEKPHIYTNGIQNYLFPFRDNRLYRNQLFGFPLVNYDLGDNISFMNKVEYSGFKIDGKKRPIFTIGSGNHPATVSSVAFDHLFKNNIKNCDWQYLYNKNENSLEVIVYGDQYRSVAEKKLELTLLTRKHFGCDVNFKFEPKPRLSKAGKLPRYVILDNC